MPAPTGKPKPAAKPKAESGDRRAPRLKDYTELRDKVDELTGTVGALSTTLTEGARSPLSGMSTNEFFDMLILAFAAASQGNKLIEDEVLYHRVLQSRNMLKVLAGEAEGEWIREKRERNEARMKAVQEDQEMQARIRKATEEAGGGIPQIDLKTELADLQPPPPSGVNIG